MSAFRWRPPSRARAPVVGYDIDPGRVAELAEGRDRTREVVAADLASANLEFTADATRLSGADFFIVTVPHQSYVERGWKLAKAHLKDGSGIVIDVRALLDRAAKPEGITLWRL